MASRLGAASTLRRVLYHDDDRSALAPCPAGLSASTRDSSARGRGYGVGARPVRVAEHPAARLIGGDHRHAGQGLAQLRRQR